MGLLAYSDSHNGSRNAFAPQNQILVALRHFLKSIQDADTNTKSRLQLKVHKDRFQIIYLMPTKIIKSLTFFFFLFD
jgi:hypothetical protein